MSNSDIKAILMVLGSLAAALVGIPALINKIKAAKRKNRWRNK